MSTYLGATKQCTAADSSICTFSVKVPSLIDMPAVDTQVMCPWLGCDQAVLRCLPELCSGSCSIPEKEV